jgi:predicted permease
MAWISRIRALFGREKLAREQEEELEFHLSMREQLNVEQGMTQGEARHDARRRFGNASLWRERMNEIDLMILPQTVLQDLRFGARILWRNAGFTGAAVFALALGIGANTATFTAYKAFFERPLDAHNSRELVNIALTLHSGATEADFSYPDYEAYRDHLHAFSGLIAWEGVERLTLSRADGIVNKHSSGTGTLVGRLGLIPNGVSEAEFASTFMVSDNYFAVLGVSALRGRTFEPGASSKVADSPAVLISENYWRKRFDGDPNLLGKTIRLNGVGFAIAGITPHNFVGTGVEVPDFWLPLSAGPLVHPDKNWLRDRENLCCRLYGRLAPGISISQAQAEMNVLAEHLRTLHDAHSDLGKSAHVVLWPGSPFPYPLKQYGGLRYAVLLIMTAVGMVLVIACANAGSLQLARAAARQNELNMRISLGASRLRIIRQLLTESAVLGLLAGGLGLLFSWAILEVLVVLAAGAFPAEYGTFIFHVTPDPGIFAYVFVLSLSAGVLFGLVPALESSSVGRSSALNANAGSSPMRSRRLRNVLMATQVAVSLTLMIAGSMLIRSAIRALRMDTGYDSKHTVALEFQFPDSSKYAVEAKAALVRELRDRLATIPGVVAITSARPPDGSGFRLAAVSLNEEKPSPQNTRAVLYYTYVQSNYFQTLDIPFLFGRGLQTQVAEPSVILSESAAQILWPGQNPIGRVLRLGTDGQFHGKSELVPDGPTYQVIGIVRDTRGILLDSSDSAQIYVPLVDNRLQDYPILIRSHSDLSQLVGAVEPVISSVDPDLVVSCSSLEELLRQTPAFLASSLAAAFASTVGILGLLLASMGIYGTVSYVVVLRTREVGIRMALGAKKKDVLILMLRESTRPVAAGLIAGICLAEGASYLLRGVLYGLRTVDFISFAGVSLVFLAIALLASYVPSRKAMRVDPIVALRYE